MEIEELLPRHVQCMVDSGFDITGRSGASGYEFESDLPQQEALRVIEECRELAPERPQLTDDRIGEIYDGWVSQSFCLVGLGYDPDEPPSPEKFIEDWRSPSGPWMPIDGLQPWLWSDEEYEYAKAECGLEFYER